MKPIKILFLIAGLFMTMASYGDLIIPNTHFVDKCIKITNLSDYPEISLIGIIYYLQGNSIEDAYLVSSDLCLYQGYRMNKFEIRATRNDYLAGRNLKETDWTSNENTLLSSIPILTSGGYFPDSNPLESIEAFYKIAGFTDTSVVLYKWKEIMCYNNGLDDSVKTSVPT
jgi:hypothetical protein